MNYEDEHHAQFRESLPDKGLADLHQMLRDLRAKVANLGAQIQAAESLELQQVPNVAASILQSLIVASGPIDGDGSDADDQVIERLQAVGRHLETVVQMAVDVTYYAYRGRVMTVSEAESERDQTTRDITAIQNAIHERNMTILRTEEAATSKEAT